jgi:hypothetical protein
VGAFQEQALQAVAMSEEGFTRRSKLREEVEALLRERGILIEKRISVVDMESGKAYHFDSYSEAIEFLAGKAGRWYIATSGIVPGKR